MYKAKRVVMQSTLAGTTIQPSSGTRHPLTTTMMKIAERVDIAISAQMPDHAHPRPSETGPTRIDVDKVTDDISTALNAAHASEDTPHIDIEIWTMSPQMMHISATAGLRAVVAAHTAEMITATMIRDSLAAILL